MNPILKFLLAGFALFLFFPLWAQPTIGINSSSAPSQGVATVEVQVMDFTDITRSQFSINWNPAELEFAAYSNLDIVPEYGLTASNFDLSDVANGNLVFNWQAADGEDLTIPDNNELTPVFNLQFNIVAAEGTTAEVFFSDTPQPIIFNRTGSGTQNIFETDEPQYRQNGTITALKPDQQIYFNFTPDKDIYCRGDQVCYDLTVVGFDSIVANQLGVKWQGSVLELAEARNIYPKLQNNFTQLIEQVDKDSLARMFIEAEDNEEILNGIVLDSNTLLATLCYNIIGDPLETTNITIGGDGAFSIEVVNNKGEEVNINSDDPSFTVTDCDNLVVFNIECENGAPGDTICVDIAANLFTDIGYVRHRMLWNTEVLNFINTQNHTLPGLDENNFTDDGSSLRLEWTNSTALGQTLPDGTVLYQACFVVTGQIDSTSRVFFLDIANEKEVQNGAGEQISDIRFNNCEMRVTPPPAYFGIDSVSGGPGERVCVPVRGANFYQVQYLELPFSWNTDILSFSEINYDGSVLTGLEDANFNFSNTNTGLLQMTGWNSPDATNGTTFTDTSELFQICFDLVGNPDETSPVNFSNTPATPVFVETINQTLDFELSSGSISITSSSIVLESASIEIIEGKSRCVDITTRNFQGVRSMSYVHTWNPAIIQLDSITNVQLEGLDPFADFVINPMNPGAVELIWDTPNATDGTTVGDESVLYSLCFTGIGALGECADFELADGSEVLTVASNGDNAGVIENLQPVCIDNFGIINERKQNPSCDGGDGMIRLDISGDEGIYTYLVQKDQALFMDGSTSDSIRLDNLDKGTYCVSILATNSNKSDNTCFDVGTQDTGTPIPDAGEDIDLGCRDITDLSVRLDGSKSQVPEGGVFEYLWTTNNGAIMPMQEDDAQPTVTAPGTYYLTVINNSNNCSATDTVVVYTTPAPFVPAIPPRALGCNEMSTSVLNASTAEIREHNIFYWTTEGGHFAADSTTLTPTIDLDGTYTFTVEDTLNGCTVSREVFVSIDTFPPRAEAGNNRMLGCDDDFIVLTGQGSTVGNVNYQWTTEDGTIVMNEDQLDVSVSRVGTYMLEVTNMSNGCTATDTMQVIADDELPVARANNMATIGCQMDSVALSGAGSSEGLSFRYRWENSSGGVVSNQLDFFTSQPDNYSLIVTNVDNDDCISDTASVVVNEDRTIPSGVSIGSLNLGCNSECEELQATAPVGEQYSYQWLTEEGIICEGENNMVARVSSIGIYRFVVTNNDNNCADTTVTIVSADGTAIFADPGPARQLGCNTQSVTLDGRGSTINDNTTYVWTSADGDTVSTEITAEITAEGQYTLMVTDTARGCTAQAKVGVTSDTSEPLAEAGEDINIPGCNFPNGLRLNGSSPNASNPQYLWRATNGGRIIADSTSATPQVDRPGTYELTVTDTNNGCTSTDIVVVTSDLMVPVPNAGMDQTLGCDNPTLTLTATEEMGLTNTAIKWFTSDGNIVGTDSAMTVIVDAPGTYMLTITSAEGCSSTDEVVIDGTLEMPDADAGEPVELVCNQASPLSATGSTGSNIVISWSTADGNIVSGANTFSPMVNLGGTYALTVTDTLSGCASTSEVTISASEELSLAQAGANQEVCGNEGSLAAQMPEDTANISGVWTTLENALIVSPTASNSQVADLQEGINTFVWTLSSENCPDYSSDTVQITVPSLPIAVDDEFEVISDQVAAQLNVVANDQLNADLFTTTIIEEPSTGSLNLIENGVYEYAIPDRFFGVQEFNYELCSAICADLCDVGTARLVVTPAAGVDTTTAIPNTITPNGDGLNDFLMFDELIFNANDYPQNELVIFNRWGDIVFRAIPYNNDFNGKSDEGDLLPEGTYYYIFRLNITEGEFMKGHVTILR